MNGFLVGILNGIQGEVLVDFQAFLALVARDQLDLRVGEALAGQIGVIAEDSRLTYANPEDSAYSRSGAASRRPGRRPRTAAEPRSGSRSAGSKPPSAPGAN